MVKSREIPDFDPDTDDEDVNYWRNKKGKVLQKRKRLDDSPNRKERFNSKDATRRMANEESSEDEEMTSEEKVAETPKKNLVRTEYVARRLLFAG